MAADDVDLNETWTTREAASCLGMSPKSVQNWDERGWLRACGLTVIRTPTGYRRFVPREVQRLAEQIKRQEVRIESGQVTILRPAPGVSE